MAHTAGADGASAVNPMEQFEIIRYIPLKLFGLDVSITNASVYMMLSVALVFGFIVYAMRSKQLVPGRAQSIAELTYEFIAGMVRDIAGPEGMKYFPFIFTLFLFILTLNVLGMLTLPLGHLSFTVTSHIIVTFGIAIVIFIGVTLLGFVKHGPGYLKLFVPGGVPPLLLPLVVPIEIISYLSRPISLAVRLFLNMMVGHTLLKILGGFVAAMGVYGALPFLFLLPIIALEMLVTFLQAFVFALLTTIYLNDALHMHDH